MEAAADAAESRRGEHCPYAIVIAADRDSLAPIIDSRDHGTVALAIPPDLSADIDGSRCGLKVIHTSDLEDSHLDDTIWSEAARSYTWKEYKVSKQESVTVVNYYEEAWKELGGYFETELRVAGIRNSMVPDGIRSRLDAQTERFLRNSNGIDQRLSLACRSFITQKMIDRAVTALSSPSPGWYKFLPISNGEQGRTYQNLFGNYLADARSIEIRDPHLRKDHQVRNVEDLLAIIREPRGCRVKLVTKFDQRNQWPRAGDANIIERLEKLKNRLVRRGFMFSYEFEDFHDREILTENWQISLGRGLDIYSRQEPGKARRAKSCNITFMTKEDTEGRPFAMPLPVCRAHQDEHSPSVRAVPGLPAPRAVAHAV